MSSLLFVIIIEYMHRVLQDLNNNLNFNYYHKCERLKIINLCFADAILCFARGNVESIKLPMQKVK